MANWNASMRQTFEYYIVNPETWVDEKQLDTVKSCTITRNSTADTLGSVSIDFTDNFNESYVRAYLSIVQNGGKERVALGTFLVQTPSESFDGKNSSFSSDGYTPLIELKEKKPPLGYSVMKNDNILRLANTLTRENLRAPVLFTSSEDTIPDNFIANNDDNWLSYLTDLISNAKFHYEIDPLGQIAFAPNQDMASLSPIWTYDDGNSSILYPDVTIDKDLYGIPNVVEVSYSGLAGHLYSRVVNDDPNSPTSTVNRGREITYRDMNPKISGNPNQRYLDEYATTLLRNLSTKEYQITYKHGYCPVRLGDCVLLNYERAGIKNVKAKVITQTITCEPGCPVEETAVYSQKLWG